MEETFPVLYFGPTAYYRMIAQAETPIWQGGERYSKQTLRNRCSIYGANGKIQLSIPVNRLYGKNTKTSELLISYVEPWQQIHWRSIKSAYGRAPYFEYFEDKIEALYLEKHEYLFDFLKQVNQVVLDILKIQSPIISLESLNTEGQKRMDAFSKEKFYPNENKYYQIFEDRHGFIPNLSILDWIFHCGNKL